jgi:hypothetical protein
MVKCTGACLDPKQYQYPRNLTLVDLRTPIGLASFFVFGYPYMQKMVIII